MLSAYELVNSACYTGFASAAAQQPSTSLLPFHAAADYKWSLDAVGESDKAAREQQLHACHQRSADKLLKLCFDNGGIYIKLGQHIGQLVSRAAGLVVSAGKSSVDRQSVRANVRADVQNAMPRLEVYAGLCCTCMRPRAAVQ